MTFDDQLQKDVLNLIKVAVGKATKEEEPERQAGKNLFDGPISRLILPPTLAKNLSTTSADYLQETVSMQLPGISEIQQVKMVTGATTYLTARRMWQAYHYVLALLKSRGIEDESCLYNLFHYIPGTASAVEFGDNILVGVRSQRLAGTHPGMVSVPAGLMRPGELICEGNHRELYEESGIPAGEITKIIAVRHPDAPSFTLMCKVQTEKSKIAKTYEAKGKTFIWVDKRRILLPAIIDGDIQPLVDEFREQNIDVPNNLQIAPDILEGLQRMYS
ncbi:hypothetical protein COV49_03695 [Candidatus Falkowbacteria bacterium CG11_big_fil_rev_8_21_14_0_20_39_10]|uniref:Nudix hydrolase domain-containing protein n=1 Tax=Candidatus Falkowbacteria bacterium CG11_big_fil_rev_8_21_14_0_20_39_10 TaxID=1974570 RepID=A0A2M6K8L7_9BACT|nr:MAG: hypothetical protein COV49_03695 [Candidatus Falkowbacteria bacterium CG11_big_fil_rev_8_21_14_0_20_39_10]